MCSQGPPSSPSAPWLFASWSLGSCAARGRTVQGPWRGGQHRGVPDAAAAHATGEQSVPGPRWVQEPEAQLQPVPERALRRKHQGGEGVWARAGSDLRSAGSPALSVGFLIPGAKAFRESACAGHAKPSPDTA